MILLWLSGAWLLGVLAGALAPGSPTGLAVPVYGLALAAGGALVLGWRNPPMRLAAAGVIVALLGLSRTLVALPPTVAPPGSLRSYNVPATAGRGAPTVTVRGLVREEPTLNNAHTALLVRLDAADFRPDGTGTPIPAPGGLLALVSRFAAVHRGDRVAVSGVLQDAPTFPGFDYRAYLLRQDLGSYMRQAQITVLEREADLSPLTRLERARREAGALLARLLPEPQAGLLRGILLNQRHALDAALAADFATTGTAHLIAISGANLTILIGIVFWLTRRRLGARWAAALALASIGLYTLFVGAEPPVVRAAIMGGLGLVGLGLGRATHAWTLLGAAALGMTLLNPLWVLDIGFQLSFAAMVGLISLTPILLTRLHRVPPGLREMLAATLAAQLCTDPLIVYHFGYLSLIGPPANLLTEPLLPFIMLTGMLTVFGGALWLPLGQGLAILCWVPLTVLITIVQTAATMPWASLPLSDVGIEGVLAWYALLGLACVALTPAGRRRLAALLQKRRIYEDETAAT
jgi:competence protein ComEC